MVREPEDIRYELEKAYTLATSGRPGPVWLDIPLDVQAAELPEEKLTSYPVCESEFHPEIPDELADRVISQLKKAKRPAIVCGIGVRHAGAADKLISFAQKHNIPVLTSISGIDLIESDHPLFFGRPGILGERCANFIMQNSDLLLVIGTRMGIRIIGYAYELVAREACKIMVDIDPAELAKPTFRPDIAVCSDAGDFLDRMADVSRDEFSSSEEWLTYCRRIREKYPVITAEHRQVQKYVSSYVFPELVGKFCRDNSVIITGNGIAYTSTFQAIPLRKGIRMFSNEACASMGYGLPAAIGAAFAGRNREVICLTGDGSIQMNIQELQTVKNYALPIKLFVYNNDGYLSIKLTQKSFFDGNFVGSEPGSGVVLPDLEKLAAAYGLTYFKLRNNQEAEEKLPQILALDGPVITEVMTDPFEVPGPKAASKRLPDGTMVSSPLEDLAPFLPREEFLSNMIIAPVEENF
jgi:acetolactate synthase-1/2/3 large subunit